MNSPQVNSSQMEFGFAETVTLKRPRKARRGAAQMRAEKLAGTAEAGAGAVLKSPPDAPPAGANKPAGRVDWTEAPGVLGSEWIEGACGNIRSVRELREAVALSACYITDLIDREIDARGHNEAWREEYESYCWTHYFRLTVETETELEELRALWWMAAVVLNTDSGAGDRSDWELFEDLCEYEPGFANQDGGGAEASFIEFLATFLSDLHRHLFRAGGGAFTERHPDPKARGAGS
jgi:hypothetical protein